MPTTANNKRRDMYLSEDPPAHRRPVFSLLASGFGSALLIYGAAIHAENLPHPASGETTSPAAESALALSSSELFWQTPSWQNLIDYVQTLTSGAAPGPKGWPEDQTLQRMKRTLGDGVIGPSPALLVDWDALAEATRSQDESHESLRSDQPTDAAVSQDSRQRADQVQQALGIYGPLHEAYTDDGAFRLVGTLSSIRPPTVSTSWFKTESEVAPPSSAEMLSGRFDIPVVMQFEPRPGFTDEAGFGYSPGLYDMLSKRQFLKDPIQHVRLFDDGRLHIESSRADSKEVLWFEADSPMCEGWLPGFSHGDADQGIWAYFGDPETAQREHARSRKARGSLYEFYLAKPLPENRASTRSSDHVLDRSATGFARATQHEFDLDHDGVPDLLIWEGVGQGPGHLGEVLSTDDPWYRLVLVNIAGRWKILGHDQFAYGCGC
ncbi:hypothetical protein [Pseudomarimonas arenosa]|uniref:VCBS repeat protein n=1 Tax=Pseudomarimonas arenosa TaxID=2774145 RepID=A0AAW3ZKZ3_9GAMM|nr:hypothetical protein [Pseudomarimonas arenosa]MBD8525352.1 hypothetical protein [Pseudomarimonas arenosa]